MQGQAAYSTHLSIFTADKQGDASLPWRSIPLGVEHIQELLCIDLLAGGEHNDLEEGGAALQKGVQVGPPAHMNLVLAPIEGDREAEVRLLAAVQRAVHQRLIQVQHL